MKDQVLSIEQMQKLKELGVDASKASMAWYQDYDDLLDRSYSLYELTNFTKKLYNIPTFTLQDMIELMPNLIEFDDENYYLFVDKNCTEYKTVEGKIICFCQKNSVLINTYNVLVWLAENKYI